jgi:LPPG:FO 2-phospho-L-lactate transferase
MENPKFAGSRITLLAGGVGAARFLRGLVRIVDPRNITVLVNTGDDEELYGLYVSPDIDTIVYTLAGLAPLTPGWGIEADTFHAKAALERLYGDVWFALGDRDLATHIFRTSEMANGRTLAECTESLCKRFGVDIAVVPITNDRLRTLIDTDDGTLGFQEYLVRRRARPVVRGIRFDGADAAKPAPGVLEAIEAADLVIMAPSNPLVSLGPMMAVSGVAQALRSAARKVAAISPIINKKAVKGPLIRMMKSLGYHCDSSGIASLYSGLASTLFVNNGDSPSADAVTPAANSGLPAMRFVESETLIVAPAAAEALARAVLDECLGRGTAP